MGLRAGLGVGGGVGWGVGAAHRGVAREQEEGGKGVQKDNSKLHGMNLSRS